MSLTVPQLAPPRPYRFGVDEFLRMAQAGILSEAPGVELIEGEVIEMAPIGPQHANVANELAERLLDLLRPDASVRVQSPVFLDEHCLPQPDIAVVRRKSYLDRHPTGADTLLLIEVADTSLVFDRSDKALLYARHGISEYWIISLPTDSVLVYRDPTADGYRSQSELRRGARVTPLAFPERELAVADLLGSLPPAR